MLVGICQFRGFTGLEIMAPETLGWPFDPVGMVQSGIKPLRGVGGRDLVGQHVEHFIPEDGGVFLGEIVAAQAPVGPAVHQAFKYLPGIGLARDVAVVVFHAGSTHIFLGQNVDGELGPVVGRGDGDVFFRFPWYGLEEADPWDVGLIVIGGCQVFREASFNLHGGSWVLRSHV